MYAIITSDVPAATIAVGSQHPAVAPRARVMLHEGAEVALIGRPFFWNGEHWQRINADGAVLTIPYVFIGD